MRVLEERPEVNLRQFLPMESAVAAEYKCQGQQQYHGHYHGALQLEFWVLLTWSTLEALIKGQYHLKNYNKEDGW